MHNLYRRASMLCLALMIGVFMAVPAFATSDTGGNPFAQANSDLLTYGKYGLIAGGVILGIMVGVRAGKALYKTLSS